MIPTRTSDKVIVPAWGAGRIGIHPGFAAIAFEIHKRLQEESILRRILPPTPVSDAVQREEHV